MGTISIAMIFLQENYAQQIYDMENTITDLMIRIKSLEAFLDLSDNVDPRKREEAELELAEIRKLVETSNQFLKELHKKNTKSFMVAAILFFLCFLCYGVYVMIFGL